MYRFIIAGLILACTGLQAQSKKPQAKAKTPVAQADTVSQDTVVMQEAEPPIPNEFAVYTKRSKTKKTKLCLNLVSSDSTLNYCVTDSVLHDPEVSKILFEAKDLDSTFTLVYVQAFSKQPSKPLCDAGKEVKLFFVRWNTKTNKAVVRSKNIESCMKAITNMSQDAVSQWDKESPLTISYHKGGSNFVEVTFDPKNYRLGLQSANDKEGK